MGRHEGESGTSKNSPGHEVSVSEISPNYNDVSLLPSSSFCFNGVVETYLAMEGSTEA